MIGTTRNLRVFAYTKPADLRKGYNGLCGLVVSELDGDPLSGDCFLFLNRRRSSCKVLVWDGTGLCIFSKRIEQGRFACLWRTRATTSSLELTMSELSLFLEGSELVGRRRLVPEKFVLRPIEERRTM
jgi:transposase